MRRCHRAAAAVAKTMPAIHAATSLLIPLSILSPEVGTLPASASLGVSDTCRPNYKALD